MVVFLYNFYIFSRFLVVCSLAYLNLSFQMFHFFLSNKGLLALVFYQFEIMSLLCSDSEKRRQEVFDKIYVLEKLGTESRPEILIKRDFGRVVYFCFNFSNTFKFYILSSHYKFTNIKLNKRK